MKFLPLRPSKETEDKIKVGQKVISLLTGIEYEIKKLLTDNSVLLHSKDQKASALVHKDHLNTFYVSADSNGMKDPTHAQKGKEPP